MFQWWLETPVSVAQSILMDSLSESVCPKKGEVPHRKIEELLPEKGANAT